MSKDALRTLAIEQARAYHLGQHEKANTIAYVVNILVDLDGLRLYAQLLEESLKACNPNKQFIAAFS